MHLRSSQSTEALPCLRWAHGVERDDLKLCGASSEVIVTEVTLRAAVGVLGEKLPKHPLRCYLLLCLSCLVTTALLCV